jgi:hypothetical protein
MFKYHVEHGQGCSPALSPAGDVMRSGSLTCSETYEQFSIHQQWLHVQISALQSSFRSLTYVSSHFEF